MLLFLLLDPAFKQSLHLLVKDSEKVFMKLMEAKLVIQLLEILGAHEIVKDLYSSWHKCFSTAIDSYWTVLRWNFEHVLGHNVEHRGSVLRLPNLVLKRSPLEGEESKVLRG